MGNMAYFFDVTETIPDGVGFRHFDMLHLLWLFAFVVITVKNCIWYRRSSSEGREKWRKCVALLLIADELFKHTMLIISHNFNLGYLPLHLCSINIFLIAFHAWKPTKTVGGFLYTVCIPGALAALLFPSWAALPLGNFMHLHSFTVHILLAMYPIVLAVGGDISPRAKDIPKCLLLLLGMAIPIYIINVLFDENFMFLMYAEAGNPLYIFEQMWGNHLYGFPVLITAVLVVMYVPLVVYRKIKKKPK